MYCDQNTRLFCKQRQNFPMDHEKRSSRPQGSLLDSKNKKKKIMKRTYN